MNEAPTSPQPFGLLDRIADVAEGMRRSLDESDKNPFEILVILLCLHCLLRIATYYVRWKAGLLPRTRRSGPRSGHVAAPAGSAAQAVSHATVSHTTASPTARHARSDSVSVRSEPAADVERTVESDQHDTRESDAASTGVISSLHGEERPHMPANATENRHRIVHPPPSLEKRLFSTAHSRAHFVAN